MLRHCIAAYLADARRRPWHGPWRVSYVCVGTDGASFADKWNPPETVDITPSESKSESNLALSGSDAIPQLERPTALRAVESPERTQQELF